MNSTKENNVTLQCFRSFRLITNFLILDVYACHGTPYFFCSLTGASNLTRSMKLQFSRRCSNEYMHVGLPKNLHALCLQHSHSIQQSQDRDNEKSTSMACIVIEYIDRECEFSILFAILESSCAIIYELIILVNLLVTKQNVTDYFFIILK